MDVYRDYLNQQCGDYLLLRKLGGGGFGEVYLGEHVYNHTQAAVKVLRIQLTRSDELKGFINEARTFRLHHPHIVPLFDFGVSREDVPFLVMEYAPYGTLRDRYPRGTRVPLPLVVNSLEQVASALHYAHQQNLIHRDVKPENMLIGADGRILLSDFGIASVVHGSLSVNAERDGFSGTLPYMAPELFNGKPRPASDQYALAIVAYEWLTGERPFRGTAGEMAMQHSFRLPPSLHQHFPDIPEDIDRVLMIALAKDPGQRFASMEAFANALRQATGMSSVSFAPSVPASPSPVAPMTPAEQMASRRALQLEQGVSALSPYPPLLVAPTSHADPPPQTTATNQVAAPPHRAIQANKTRRSLLIAATIGTGAVLVGGTALLVSALDHQPVKPVIKKPTGPLQGSLRVTYAGHVGMCNAACWSPDGKWIASAGEDKTIQVWDAMKGGKAARTYVGHTDVINTLAWSPDGKWLASGSADRTVRIWNAEMQGASVRTFRGYSSLITSVSWSPDSKHVASVALTDDTLFVWDVIKQELIFQGNVQFKWLMATTDLYAVACAPDSKRIAVAGQFGTLEVWEYGNTLAPETANSNAHTETNVRAVMWSRDGSMIVSTGDDGIIQVSSGLVSQEAENIFRFTVQKPQHVATWSADGKYIASTGDDGMLYIWDAVNQLLAPHAVYTAPSRIESAVWSAQGYTLALACDDSLVRIWQM